MQTWDMFCTENMSASKHINFGVCNLTEPIQLLCWYCELNAFAYAHIYTWPHDMILTLREQHHFEWTQQNFKLHASGHIIILNCSQIFISIYDVCISIYVMYFMNKLYLAVLILINLDKYLIYILEMSAINMQLLVLDVYLKFKPFISSCKLKNDDIIQMLF